jgi:hypothetical protein
LSEQAALRHDRQMRLPRLVSLAAGVAATAATAAPAAPQTTAVACPLSVAAVARIVGQPLSRTAQAGAPAAWCAFKTRTVNGQAIQIDFDHFPNRRTVSLQAGRAFERRDCPLGVGVPEPDFGPGAFLYLCREVPFSHSASADLLAPRIALYVGGPVHGSAIWLGALAERLLAAAYTTQPALRH